MSQYLTRLDIANVGNVAEEIPTQYLKRVNIVEVVDQDGNPWEPGPGPWQEVYVTREPRWDNGNVYDPETEIACQTAVFAGGIGDVTYRFRWQWKPYGGNWNSTAWSGYLNTPEGDIWEIPKEAQDGDVRMQCQAVDVYENEDGDSISYNVNSFAEVKKVNAFPPFQILQQPILPGLLLPGETYSAVPAIWEGGTDESTYRARWEWLPTPNSIWQLGEWQEYDNNALLAEVEFTVPMNAGGGQVRIMSQARDPYVLNSNNTSNTANIERGPVTVGDFTIDGLPYVGQTITANQPLVVGGIPPYNILYDFGGNGSTSQSATYTVQESDIGRMISCMVTAIDTNFDSNSKSSTNQIGNIQAAISLTPVTVEVDGEVADISEFIPFTSNTPFTFVVTPFEYPNDFQISASARQGDGTLVQNDILSEEFTYTPASTDTFVQIMVSMDSDIAGDHDFNLMFSTTAKAATEIGNVSLTVNDVEHNFETSPTITILKDDPIVAHLTIDGDADPTYVWAGRAGYPLMVGSQTANTVLTFPQAGPASISCDMTDPDATDSPKKVIVDFMVVDAL